MSIVFTSFPPSSPPQIHDFFVFFFLIITVPLMNTCLGLTTQDYIILQGLIPGEGWQTLSQ